jgi:hypothetical protein
MSYHFGWELGGARRGWIGRREDALEEASPSVGVCLPSDDKLTSEAMTLLDGLFEQLKNKKIPFRTIPEALLTEEWDGLDSLVVLQSALTVQGKRKLHGFCAAGGRVFVQGEPLGLSNEFSVETL